MTDRIDRRGLLTVLAGVGAGLASPAPAATPPLDAALVDRCDIFAGLDFTGPERQQMLATLDESLDRLRALRAVHLDNALAPAETFDPRLPGWRQRPVVAPAAAPALPPLPRNAEDIAFAPAWAQAGWIAAGRLTSRALVEIYLARIARRARRLEAIATLLADGARAEADALDREQARGHLRGPLHGLPYGLKDLVDTRGARTGWGAEPFRDRIPDEDATIVTRLRAAGAVLLAKTSCGAIAYGDIWYGGRTRNPWNVAEGSSGSSAGSAALVADGLCSFAIGTETMGSIVAPAARCGAVGLRPTFGRVARTGAMALCWSLDKIGVLARTAGDAALVLPVLNGADAHDPAAYDVPLHPLPAIDPRAITLGYRPEWFEGGPVTDARALAAAREAGFRLVPIELPTVDTALLGAIVVIEAAAAFEELTLDGRDDMLGWQAAEAWPNSWRAARFEPAIGYVQAQRLRRKLMIEFAATMAIVDAVLHPNQAGHMLGIGNHAGYPALVLPVGLVGQPTRTGFAAYLTPGSPEAKGPRRKVPFSISLTGHLFDEATLLAIGMRLEQAFAYRARPRSLP